MNKKTVSLISLLLLVTLLFIGISNQEIVYNDDDLETIKEIIMTDREPTEYEMKRLDINKDNRITASDYLMIKNRLEDDLYE